MKILERNSNTINIATFWENHQLNKYNYSPDYQRPSNVWSVTKKSFLIDTILKNFPIPPIFLHQHIDVNTGKTIYDIIDGKQRLTTIIDFIENRIFIPDDFNEDGFGNDELCGLYFKDLDNKENEEWKKIFWKYEITIEYIDTSQINIVNNIFDRLNRNGEPLTNQELRNAKYNQTKFYSLIKNCSSIDFWDTLLDKLEKNRLEHLEFVSELLFIILENKIFASDNAKIIDDLYEKYSKIDLNIDEIITHFKRISEMMESFSLNYEKYKIYGVSHLYGLFGLAWTLDKRDIHIKDISEKLNSFYELLRKKSEEPNIVEYRTSMSAGTKSKARKLKRINSLLSFLELDLIK